MAIFIASTLLARFLCRKFLRIYFLFSQTRVPTVEEALRQGEGTQVEFKRALSDDEGAQKATVLKCDLIPALSGSIAVRQVDHEA